MSTRKTAYPSPTALVLLLHCVAARRRGRRLLASHFNKSAQRELVRHRLVEVSTLLCTLVVTRAGLVVARRFQKQLCSKAVQHVFVPERGHSVALDKRAHSAFGMLPKTATDAD